MYDHWWLVKLSLKSVVQRNFAYVREFKKYLAVAAFYYSLQLIESYCTHSHFHLYTELQFLFTASIFTESNLKCYAAFPVFLRKCIIIVSVFGHHWGQACLENNFFSESYWIWGNVIDLVALKAGVIFDAWCSMTVMDYCVETEAVPFSDLRGGFHHYKIYSWNSFSTKLWMCQLKNANVESISFFMKYVCKEVWL